MENGRCRDGSRANHGACGSWIGMVVPIGLEEERKWKVNENTCFGGYIEGTI